MDVDEEIGRRIEALRTSAGLGQKDLSDKLRAVGVNWSQGTLSKVENGSRPIRFTEAVKVAEILNISTVELQPSGGAIDLRYQKAVWSLRSARDDLDRAEDSLRWAANTVNALQLVKELLNGATGPYIVQGTARDLAILASPDFDGGRASQALPMLETLGVSPDRIATKRAEVESDIAASTEGKVVPDRFPEWAVSEAAQPREDREDRGILVDELVVRRYAEELLTERFPFLAFAEDSPGVEMTGKFTVDGIPDAAERTDV